MVSIALRDDDELDHWDGPLCSPSLLAWAKPALPVSVLTVWLSLQWVSHCSLFVHESQKWHLGNVPKNLANLLGILAPQLLTGFTAVMGAGRTDDTLQRAAVRAVMGDTVLHLLCHWCVHPA